MRQNLKIDVANGEEVINNGDKFDRIICNLVLMITENPNKMLSNLWNMA